MRARLVRSAGCRDCPRLRWATTSSALGGCARTPEDAFRVGKERDARISRVIARMALMPDSDGESVTPAGGTAVAERPVEEILAQTPWVTIVWDDPVNLMSYVTHVFVTYFHYTKSKAEKLMLQVHTTGKAIVSSGTREAMERDVTAMHEYGLWATLDKSDK